MIASFKLINNNNEVYDLNDVSHIAQNFSGLGVDLSNSYISLGENFKINSKDSNQSTLSFDLIFGADNVNPYLGYKKFGEFLMNAPITFQYTLDNDQVLRDIDFSSIEKGEINTYSELSCNVKFKCLTPYYEIKKYRNDDFVNNELTVTTKSNTFVGGGNSPVVIKIIDSAANPYWVVNQNGKKYCDDGYITILNKGDILTVDSRPSKVIPYIQHSDGSTESAYQLQNLNYSGFVTLPNGTSTLKISNASNYEVTIIQYRSMF